jgi:hypothetical protein
MKTLARITLMRYHGDMPVASRSTSTRAPKGRRPRDEGRATFQPTEVTEIAAKLLMRQDPSLSRTAAIRFLADIGAGRAAYEALRSDRTRDRKAAFHEMMDALADATPVTDESWDAAVMSLRSGAPRSARR